MAIKQLAGLAKMASGLNWYKYGIIAALLLGWTVAVHMRATHSCELKQEEAKTEAAEQKVLTITQYVGVRIPEVQIREVESTKAKEEIKRLKEKLDDAIEARSENPSCDLSDAELDGFRKLSEKTRPTK